VPQVFDLWADPQERYDIFMNNFTESTWALVPANEVTRNLYLEYPPRPLQSEGYSGPITLIQYFRFSNVREELEKQGFTMPMPSGN
jgi:arylsulfatase